MIRLVRIDPPWDQRLVNLLIRPLLSTGITPNVVTSFGLLLGLGACWCYALGGAYAHLGSVLFIAAYVIDHADGELARLTGRTSAFGHYYDLVVDGIVVAGLCIGIGIGLQDSVLSVPTAWLGAIAGISIALIFVLRFELERQLSKAVTRQPNVWGFEVQDVLYLIGPITWLGWLHPFLVAAAVGAPLYAFWVAWTWLSWYRRPAGT